MRKWKCICSPCHAERSEAYLPAKIKVNASAGGRFGAGLKKLIRKMKILLFGELTDIAGNSIEIQSATDIDTLQRNIHQKFPALQNCKYQVAVNNHIAVTNISLNETDEVALLPAFSGG